MNYQSMMDVAIYPWESRHDLLDLLRGVKLPDGAIEFRSRAMLLTESAGDPFKPTQLVMYGMLRNEYFDSPKLVQVRSGETILSAFLPRGSGELGGIQEVFIVLLPAGTFEWPYDDHPKLRTESVPAPRAPCAMCEWIKVAQLHPSYAADRMAGPGHTCRD